MRTRITALTNRPMLWSLLGLAIASLVAACNPGGNGGPGY
jgi:hypothetical protein